jgi:hypothetical protein
LGERPTAPSASARRPFDRLDAGSFFKFPGPGFRAAKPAAWAAVSNWRRLLARIDILELPFANANGISVAWPIDRR